VLRALYAGDMTGEQGPEPLAQLLAADPPREVDVPFAERLSLQAQREAPRYDREIEQHLENWDLSRLALIDLLLLRIALAEFDCCPEIPHRVTLNEVIELAKQYSGAQAGAFVNGVLDAVLKRRDAPPGAAEAETKSPS
jgi:N utilization substance protein B